LINVDEAAMGFVSPAPRTRMPYSVSMPRILGIATFRTYRY
jgi:hypothetical protein